MIVRLVLGLYLLSGFSSLVYEVVWTRLLTLILGSTVYAVSVILAVFMTGLALGSYLAGRVIGYRSQQDQKRRSPLVLYGFLQGAIGLYALVLPFFLNRAEGGYLAIHTALQPSFMPALILKAGIAAVLLFPPAVLMGATFPFMCLSLHREQGQLGRVLGSVYGINTTGAVIGTVAAGFFLIPMFGVKGTIGWAVAFDFFVCVASFILSPFLVEHRENIPSASAGIEPTENSPMKRSIFMALGLSGFALMAYEVLWTRILVLVWPSTTYAFSIMLAVILTGLAAGSTIGSRIVNRLKELTTHLCWVQAGIAFSAVTGLALLNRIHTNGFVTMGSNQAWGMAMIRVAAESFLLMAIPAVLTGAVYPLAGRLMMEYKGMASHPAGLVYAVGTTGGVLGAVLSGFVLIPWMGITRAFMLTAGMNLLSGFVFLLGNRRAGTPVQAFLRAPAIGITAATVALVSVFVSILPLKLPTGLTSDDAVLYDRDGADATIKVYREKTSGDLVLQANSQVMARTNYGAMVEQKLRGHIPLLVHRHPNAVLQVGLGSGITLAAMADYPLERVESVEISPKVIEAAGLFSDYNRNVLSGSNVKVIENDGRNYLLSNVKKYDIIVSDSQPPWTAGIVNLYTQDYYRLASSRLNKDGMMSQMVPLYGLSLDQIKTVIRTFQSVFPYTSVWLTYGELLLLGQKEDIPIDFNRMRSSLDASAAADDLKTIFRDRPSGILRSFVLGWKTVKAFTGEGPVITDSHPTLEFTAPKTFYRTLEMGNADELNRFRDDATRYLTGLSDDDSREIRAAQRADALLVDGRVAMARNDLKNAVSMLTEARKVLDKDDELDSMLTLAHFGLAKRYFENGLYGNSRPDIEKALAVSPRFLPARYLLAELSMTFKNKEAAKEQYEEILRLNSESIEAYLRLGEIFEEAGEYEKALEQYKTAISIRADDPKAYQLMARVRYKRKEYQEAASLLEFAVTKDSDHETLLYHLAETYERFDCAKARTVWTRFLSMTGQNQVDPQQVKEVRNHLSGLADGMKPCSSQ